MSTGTIAIGPVEGTPFAPIVAAESTVWSNPKALERLRVGTAEHLGEWLMYAHGGGGYGLVGFSIDNVENHGVLTPPKTLEEAAERVGRTAIGPLTLSPFNSDLAKGVGTLITNTPEALQPHTTQESDIAIRLLPFVKLEEFAHREDSQSLPGRTYGFLRHGSLLVAATVIDGASHSLKGTAMAIGLMERHYGDRRLVGMAPAPVWHAEYLTHGVEHTIPPRVVLVRGGQLATQNVMQHLGTYKAHRQQDAA